MFGRHQSISSADRRGCVFYVSEFLGNMEEVV